MMIGSLVAAFAEVISAEEWELHMVSGDVFRVLDDDMQLNSDRRENSVWEIVKRNQWDMGTSWSLKYGDKNSDRHVHR